jgi:hypothetical protein
MSTLTKINPGLNNHKIRATGINNKIPLKFKKRDYLNHYNEQDLVEYFTVVVLFLLWGLKTNRQDWTWTALPHFGSHIWHI